MTGFSLVSLGMVLSMFPWIGSAFNGLDTQPWVTVVLAFSYLIYFRNKNISLRLLLTFLITLGISLFVEISASDFLGSVRILITVFNIYLAIQLGLLLPEKKVSKIIFASNIIYLFGALIQLLMGADILMSIVDVRTNGARGVTSFAAEPTFFAISLLLFSIYYDVSNKYSKLILVNLIVCVFVAKSSAGTVGFLVYFSVAYLSSSSIRTKVISILVSFALVGIILNTAMGRISILAVKIADSNNIVASDESVKIRVLDFLTAPYMVIENNGLGIRSDEVSSKRNLVLDKHFSSEYGYLSSSGKTSSYIGSLLVHFGLVFVLLFFWSGFLIGRLKRTAKFFGFWCVLILSVPPSSVLVPFIFSAFFRKSNHE